MFRMTIRFLLTVDDKGIVVPDNWKLENEIKDRQFFCFVFFFSVWTMNNALVLVFSMFIFSHQVVCVRITVTHLRVCLLACLHLSV